MAPLEIGIVLHAGHGAEVGPALVHDGGSRHVTDVTGRQRVERLWPGSEAGLYSSIPALQRPLSSRQEDLKTAPSTGERLLKWRRWREKFWTQMITIHTQDKLEDTR